jgi:hypothetical protein
VGGPNAVVELGKEPGNARLAAEQVEREPAPAEVFEVVTVNELVAQIPDRRLHPRLAGVTLEGQQHERRRPGNRFGHPAEDHAVAVIRAALFERPVEQQPFALADSCVIALPQPVQRQAGPTRRLDPRERRFAPGPAGERHVDVAHVGDFGVRGDRTALDPKQDGRGRGFVGRRRVAGAVGRLGEQRHRRAPHGGVAAACQAVRPVRSAA